MTESKPLVLDIDGTFLRTDMLLECFWGALGKDPLAALRVSVTHLRDRARLKQELAALADLRVDLLPVNAGVAEMAAGAKAEGHEVILASASDAELVSALAAAHDLSPRSFGSTPGHNLKGARKAEALVQAFGERGFHYAGNEPVDMGVWKHADGAVIVGKVKGAEAALKADGHPVTAVPGGWSWRHLAKALRPHQWVKNVLLLLPLIAAHAFDAQSFVLALLGIVAFSAAASSIYVVNDLLDLEADRLHAKKHKRPFASGSVPIGVGMAAGVGAGLVALGVGAALGWAFFGVVVLYMVLSLAYSLRLKRMRWVDVATLAMLYTLRVVAGAAAAKVDVTGYLLVFIFPIFLTLGCVKRLTELTLAKDDARLPGRGYARGDRGDLLNVAGLGMVGTLLIFFLYSFTEQAQGLYPSTWLLWVALIPMAGWLWRMIRLGYHGKQDYDPIVFALRDKRGIGLLLIILSLLFYAAGLFQQWFGI